MVNGFYNTETGTFTESANRRATDLIPVSPGLKIVSNIVVNGSDTVRVFFYTDNVSNFVSTASKTITDEYATFVVPSSANMVAFNIVSSNVEIPDMSDYWVGTEYKSGLIGKVGVVEQNFTTEEKEQARRNIGIEIEEQTQLNSKKLVNSNGALLSSFEELSITVSSTGIISNEGTVIPNSNYDISTPISVSKGMEVVVYSKVPQADVTCVAKINGSRYIPLLVYDDNTLKYRKVTITEDCKIVICASNNYDYKLYIRISSLEAVKTKEDFIKFEEDVTGVQNIEIPYINGSYSTSDGSYTANASKLATDFIAIPSGVVSLKTNIKTNSGTKLRIFFYSAANTSNFITTKNITAGSDDIVVVDNFYEATHITLNVVSSGSIPDTSSFYIHGLSFKGIASMVSFLPQALSDEQKQQVRDNIGISNVDIILPLNIGSIEQYATDVSIFKYTSDFQIVFAKKDIRNKNIIISSFAKYVLNSSSKPTIKCTFGTGSTPTAFTTMDMMEYVIGSENVYEKKQWRIPVAAPEVNWIVITVTIPSGTELYIKEFDVDYSEYVNFENNSYNIVSHGGLYGAFNTINQITNAAKTGFKYVVVVPKRTSDGIWVCFHDDDNINNIRYPNNQIVCQRTTVEGQYVYTQYDENGNVIGNNAMPISSMTWAELKDLIYFSYIFKNSNILKMEEVFKICQKTGTHIVFSIHPRLSAIKMTELKTLAKKYDVLKQLTLKAAFGGTGETSISDLFAVFGHDVEGYCQTGNISKITNSINDVVGSNIDVTKLKIGFEFSDTSLVNTTDVNTILNAEKNGVNCGFYASVVANEISCEEMTGLMALGITWFTNENNQSYGLNW